MKEKDLKRKLIHYAAVLTSICLVCGVALSFVHDRTRHKIRQKEEEAFEQKLCEVLGDARNPRAVADYDDDVPLQDRIYVADAPGGVRYAAMGRAQGYADEIRVLLSLEAPSAGQPLEDDPLIYRLAVVYSNETPGLGENIREVEPDKSLWGAAWDAIAGNDQREGPSEKKRPTFQVQFSKKRVGDLVIDKTPRTKKILPITGATDTSTAVVEAACEAAERIIKKTHQLYGQPE